MEKYTQAIRHYISRTGFETIRPEAALIDMDGTLYDSMPSHAHAWKLMMTEEGFSIPEEEFFSYEGMTGEATIAMLFERDGRTVPPVEEIRNMYKRKTEYFIRDGKAPVMPGARKMVHELKKLGIERVLVTGSGQMSVINRVCTDFDNLFSTGAMITSHDVVNCKPAPEPYIKGMEIAGKTPDKCIVVENAPLGIIAGVRSGAFTVGICTGPIPEKEMLAANPDILFDSMPDFADALPELVQTMRNYKH